MKVVFEEEAEPIDTILLVLSQLSHDVDRNAIFLHLNERQGQTSK